MKEYEFQYTKKRDTLFVFLACLAIFIIVMFIGIYLSLQLTIITVIDIILMFLIFRFLKKKAVSECIAKVSETSVEFNFKNDISRVINFSDLISFKTYYGKNGTALYLKNTNDNFKMFANNNFCDPDAFNAFCEDLIIQLDKYKINSNSNIIHESSIFATKGMLYFLVAITLVYLVSFFFETKTLKVAIGIWGGLYLLLMWTKYFIENKKKP